MVFNKSQVEGPVFEGGFGKVWNEWIRRFIKTRLTCTMRYVKHIYLSACFRRFLVQFCFLFLCFKEQKPPSVWCLQLSESVLAEAEGYCYVGRCLIVTHPCYAPSGAKLNPAAVYIWSRGSQLPGGTLFLAFTQDHLARVADESVSFRATHTHTNNAE